MRGAIYAIETHRGLVHVYQERSKPGYWHALCPGIGTRDIILSSAIRGALCWWERQGKPESSGRTWHDGDVVRLSNDEAVQLERVGLRAGLRDAITGSDSYIE